MRRYFRYIFLALILGILAMSCIEELDAPQIMQENEELTLVPRVKSFTNHYVTKSDYTGLETTIKKVSILVFDSDGKLVHLHEGSGESVIINKSMLNSSDTQTEKLKAARIVMFANMNLSDIKKGYWSIIQNQNEAGLTPEDLKNYVCNFVAENTVIPAPLPGDFEGFPMVGSKTLDLTSTTAKQDPVTVDLQILYAKINFSISVEAGTENEVYEGKNVSFALKQYSVHNASMATKLEDITASETAADAATDSRDYAFSDDEGTTITATGNQFTFYVAENRYNPYTGSKPDYPDYASLSEMGTIYPSDWLTPESELDVKDPAEDQPNGVKYFYDDKIQQYKPNLVTKAPAAAGKPTYVTLTGVYTDYRGTLWDVDYDIYLGKDNAHNFHVDRNSAYTNHITIKGIRNRQEGAYGEGDVWIDHRVDVSLNSDSPNKGADCVTITRETLIDSHIEVRPLRVNLPDDIDRVFLYLPKYDEYNGMQIEETAEGENVNWIAIENNNGRVKDITQFSANGKRKYFTTSLIKKLYLENNDETYGIKTNEIPGDERNGQKFIQLFNGDCAWIYIDENASEKERTAEVDLVFYDADLNPVGIEVFNIIQNGLTQVGDHYIEQYEEYLHTYDSQDLYTNPVTDYTQQGYKWGLEGIYLSNQPLSKKENVASIPVESNIYYYDYFHAKDKQSLKSILNTDYNVRIDNNVISDLSDHWGLEFTNNAGIANEMTIIDMSTRPLSAIQYCLSKNKFQVDESNAEKHKMYIHWYLPDVYEMSEILSAGKDYITDFKEYAYWTSQPAWKSADLGIYLTEDTEKARSVSLADKDAIEDGSIYSGTNASRETPHRIRCAYSVEGIDSVDFSGSRAPEGIGAMHFYMRAWKNWDTKEPGYFSWDGCLYEDYDVVETDYTLPDTYPFPKVAADADEYFGPYVDGYGFAKDPSDSENWKTETVNSIYTSNLTLYKWPGLTTSQVVSKNTYIGSNIYYALDGTKEDWESTDTTNVTKYSGDITTSQLNYLDHMFGGSDLSIGFMTGDGGNSPKFEYYKVTSVASKKTTRTWLTPKYVGNDKVESENKGPIYTPSGNVILTTDEESDRVSKNGTIAINSDGYIYPDEQSAITAGRSIVPSGAYNISVVPEKSGTDYLRREIPIYSYTTSTWWGTSTTYVRKARYRYKVTYTLDGQTVTYYQYDKDGCWKYGEPKSETVPNTDPPTDQLEMYGGNSFTIRANNGNIISSVKIYFSGSNVVDTQETGYDDYLRFTKDGWTGNSKVSPPEMSYSANGDTGTMTWTGDAVNEITFKLVLYRETRLWFDWFGRLEPQGFQYIANTTASKAESIVIDQIDVRYKKAD